MLYDFEHALFCDDDTGKWRFVLYNMSESECDEWFVYIMKLRDFLIERACGKNDIGIDSIPK